MIAHQIFRFVESEGKQTQVQPIGSSYPSHEQAAAKMAELERTFQTFQFEIHTSEASERQIDSWRRKRLLPEEKN
jgi:hypothetical protein